MIANCKKCNKQFKTYPSRIKNGRGIYCSKKCSNSEKYGNPNWVIGYKNFKAKNNPQVFKKGSIPWNKGKEYLKGEKHWNWKGGINLENERLRHSQRWMEWRDFVYRRDKWTCQKCGKHCFQKEIVAHHIKLFSKFIELRFDVDNGVTLCRKCHAKIHKINTVYLK